MTKTTAEVKRWDANGPMDLEPEGSYVLATDYATLQQRCAQLEELLAKAQRLIGCQEYDHELDIADINEIDKALGGEKGVGTCQA